MKDKVTLKLIELERELKQIDDLLSDINQTDATYRKAHVDRVKVIYGIHLLKSLYHDH